MNCGEITMALKKCVDAHPEYYGKLSEAPEKEAEKKEVVTPAEAPAEAPEKVEAPKEEEKTEEAVKEEEKPAAESEEEYHPWWIGVKEISLFMSPEETEKLDAMFPATRKFK